MPEVIPVQPEFAGILREQQTYAVRPAPEMGSSERMGNQINSSFDRLMIQSGVEAPPFAVLFLCILAAIAAGGLVFVIQENPLTAAIAFLAGLIVPILALMAIRMQRQTKLMNQMPGMIDELARAAKTGRSLEHCLDTVAHDTPAPLGSEMQLCSRKIALGLPMEHALDELPYRTGLVSASVLSTQLAKGLMMLLKKKYVQMCRHVDVM